MNMSLRDKNNDLHFVKNIQKGSRSLSPFI